jgi:dynein heavy chain
MWQESTPRVPMVCFLSMGSDPTNSIDMLARKHDLSKQQSLLLFFTQHNFCCAIIAAFGSVSMGQGQEVHARRLINQCHAQVRMYI